MLNSDPPSLRRLERLLAQSPAVFYLLRLESGLRELCWVSPNSSRLLGYAPAELCQPGWWAQHVHPEDWVAAIAAREPREQPSRLPVEYRLRHKDGSYCWVRDQQEWPSPALEPPGELVGSWLDVTVQRQLQSQLQECRQLGLIAPAPGGLLHEFNNLLTVIRGNVELALMSSNPAQQEQRAVLKQALKASDRAVSLSSQLLERSRSPGVGLQGPKAAGPPPSP